MNLTDILRAVSIIQFIIVGLFLITHKRGNKTANRLLAFFLAAKAVCYLGDYSYIYLNYFVEKASYILALAPGFDLLLGPPLYLYAKSLAYKDYQLNRYQLIHVIPFLIFPILFMLYIPDTINYSTFRGFILSTPAVVLNSAVYFHFIIYSVFCLLVLKKYNEKLKENYTSIEKKRLGWLFFLITGFIIIWLCGYFNYMAFLISLPFTVPWEFIILTIFVFANIIVLLGLKQPELFSGIEREDNQPRYTKTPLAEEKKKEYLEKLLAFMKNEKPYLNPSLTLTDVSEKIAIPSHYISQVINTCLKKNFYDFVNGYRVEECKIYFMNNTDDTVLKILYDKGFNSKSSFNRAFKKYTGMTPTEFRKNREISFTE